MAVYEDVNVEPSRAAKASTLATFTEAQRHYRAGNFTEGMMLFERVLAASPYDAAARLLCERCHTLITSPPGTWNGVCLRSAK